MSTNQQIASSSVTAVLVCLAGCAAPVHLSKSVDSSAISVAAREIGGAPNWAPHYVGDEEAEKKVLEIYAKLLPAATDICRRVGEDECAWDVRYSTDDSLNAFAAGESVVVIKKGVIRHAENDDEIAMVIAHEMSHHAANHISETVQNAQTGAVVGALIFGALASYAYSGYGYSPAYQQYQINSAVNTGVGIGATVGHLSYSKDQENEADYLAAYIIDKSGYDMAKARTMWIKIARLGSTEHGERHSAGTHPDPAERLARWDETVKEVGANAGILPKPSIDRIIASKPRGGGGGHIDAMDPMSRLGSQ